MLRQAFLPSVALAVALACLPAHAAQRAVVSSVGNDANVGAGCTLAAPCRSLQAAHDAVDAGGEIVALDSAGYGPVTITKSVSILGNPGVTAGISVASGAGISIVTAGVNVHLRNVNINGTGGVHGVHMTAGDSLTIENCVISNLSDSGVRVNAPADVRIVDSVMRGSMRGAFISGGASADIVNSRFMGNALGLAVGTISGGTTRASVSGSVASGNEVGFLAFSNEGVSRMTLIRSTAADNLSVGFQNDASGTGATSVMSVGGSQATGNGFGFFNFPNTGIAIFESLGNNIVRQNSTNSSGAITAVAGM